MLNLPECNH